MEERRLFDILYPSDTWKQDGDENRSGINHALDPFNDRTHSSDKGSN